MHLGRCCQCNGHAQRAVTIKGLNIADGTTEWEYGPGFHWRHHYGLDQITGIEPLSDTLDRYVIAATVGTLVWPFGNRNTSTLVANAVESLYLTKLDSTDGSVVSNVLVSGLFASAIGQVQTTLVNGTIIGAAALSGGNYVCVGGLHPAIEFEDFTANLAAKDYILHAHGMQAGNVTLKTRTSDETITLAYNTTAAAAKTAFEATADCVSATCTGGPWPHAAINAAVTWSVAGGDIKSISRDTYYDVSGTDRRVDCSAYTWDPATGLLANSVGYVFGQGTTSVETKLIPSSGLIPSPVVPPLGALDYRVMAGASNRIVAITNSNGRLSNLLECWNVDSTWSVQWQKFHPTQILIDGPGLLPQVENDSVGVSFGRASFNTPTRTRCGATVALSTGTVTEIDNSIVSTSTTRSENVANMVLRESTPGTQAWRGYERKFSQVDYPNLQFDYHSFGDEVEVGGTNLHIGVGKVYGFDATNVYGEVRRAVPLINASFPLLSPPSFVVGSAAKGYEWRFFTEGNLHLETGTQFRFKIGPLTTGWIDWHATAADIETAILATIGNNTEGLSDSVVAYPTGAETPAPVNTISLLEQSLLLYFGGAVNQSGLEAGFLSAATHFVAGKIKVEIQTPTYATDAAGLGAFDIATGDHVWSRSFGTTLANSSVVDYPAYAWLRGSFIYAVASGLLEDELP